MITVGHVITTVPTHVRQYMTVMSLPCFDNDIEQLAASKC